MSRLTLAAFAVPAALILPLTVPGVADAAGAAVPQVQAAPAAFTAAARPAPSTVAHRRHLSHLHHEHVLHVRHELAADVRQRVVKAAERYLGQPYVYGGLDCSSLTQRAYAAVGKHLPRSAAAQGRIGRRVSRPKPGDIVAWSSGGAVYHVAILVRAGLVVVARHTGTVVGFQRIWGSPIYRSLLA